MQTALRLVFRSVSRTPKSFFHQQRICLLFSKRPTVTVKQFVKSIFDFPFHFFLVRRSENLAQNVSIGCGRPTRKPEPRRCKSAEALERCLNLAVERSARFLRQKFGNGHANRVDCVSRIVVFFFVIVIIIVAVFLVGGEWRYDIPNISQKTSEVIKG